MDLPASQHFTYLLLTMEARQLEMAVLFRETAATPQWILGSIRGSCEGPWVNCIFFFFFLDLGSSGMATLFCLLFLSHLR